MNCNDVLQVTDNWGFDKGEYMMAFDDDCPEGCYIILCSECVFTSHFRANESICHNCGAHLNYPPGANW